MKRSKTGREGGRAYRRVPGNLDGSIGFEGEWIPPLFEARLDGSRSGDHAAMDHALCLREKIMSGGKRTERSWGFTKRSGTGVRVRRRTKLKQWRRSDEGTNCSFYIGLAKCPSVARALQRGHT